MKPLGGLLHLGFTSQEPVIIYSLCECVEGEISILLMIPLLAFNFFSVPYLTRELRACTRASYRYDVGNAIRSLDWSIPVMMN